MNLRMFKPKFYLDRTELPILNDFPLGGFLVFLYLVALPKLWQQVGAGIHSVVPFPLVWSANAVQETVFPVPVCEDDFSKYLLGRLAKADAIIAGILADQEPLLDLPMIVNSMAFGIESIRFQHRFFTAEGTINQDRTHPPSALELVINQHEKLLKEAETQLRALPKQHAHLVNITIQEYQTAFASLKELKVFSQKQSGYVKLRSFLSSKYAEQRRHSQYFESRALNLLRYHIEELQPVVDHTLHMTQTLHNLFEDLTHLPNRLEAVVGVPADEDMIRIPGSITTDKQARMATLLMNFHNNKKIHEWLTRKTSGMDWLSKIEDIFPSINDIYGARLQEVSEIYKELRERLHKEAKRGGWFGRFRDARSGTVGCAGVVEEMAEELEDALAAWWARKREWYHVTMRRITEGRSVNKTMLVGMLKGEEKGYD